MLTNLKSVEDDEGSQCVGEAYVHVQVRCQGRQENQAEEYQEEWDLCAIERVLVDALSIFPARPEDAGVGYESNHSQYRYQDR